MRLLLLFFAFFFIFFVYPIVDPISFVESLSFLWIVCVPFSKPVSYDCVSLVLNSLFFFIDLCIYPPNKPHFLE